MSRDLRKSVAASTERFGCTSVRASGTALTRSVSGPSGPSLLVVRELAIVTGLGLCEDHAWFWRTPLDTTAKSEEFVEVIGGSVAVLSPQTGEPAGPPIAVGTTPCIVGRGEHCQLVVRDPRVSVSHCELLACEGGVRVRDLDSRNGTFVHQARIESGGSVYLTADARLRCGETWFAFRAKSPEAVPISSSRTFGPLVGRSPAMRRIYAQLDRVAPHDVNVLITGETGTGKELVAQAIHLASRRQRAPFVIVDCTTIPASLAESRLFGHEKGAFTGAVARQTSPFVDAAGGTIFFDELGELPADVQPKLLRALEARQIQSVGSSRYQPIDVRVVAATRRDMHMEMNAKRFRDDLYYRFAQVVIEVPPLRKRPEDIPDLVARFLNDLGDPGAVNRLDRPTMDRLVRHDWPGNVRELRNVILAAHAQSGGGPIEVADLLGARAARTINVRRAGSASGTLSFPEQKRELVEAFEREFFIGLHKDTGGNISEMSRRSGIERSTVRQYLARLGLREVE
jgi:DNA-binding NtrC family response regulator